VLCRWASQRRDRPRRPTMKTIRTLVTTLALTFATLAGSTALAAGPTESDSGTSSETSSRSGASLEGQININTATMAELEQLPGVGPAIAERIVTYRKDNPFKQRNQIMRIKGIGEKTFAKIKDYLVVEGDTTLRVVK
jgi:competence protein ComEA